MPTSEINCLLIFDLDDTLVDTSDVYWTAKKQFITILVKNSPVLSEEFIDSVFEEIDTRNLHDLGYSPARYGKSMRDTYKHFIKQGAISSDIETERAINRAGKIVENTIPNLMDGSIELLRWCKGKFKVALITRGEKTFQKKKIQNLSLSGYFDLIKIVSKKGEDEFTDVMDFFKIVAKSTWIIGDSLKAEIEAGLKIGANCIFFNYTHSSYNWVQERNYSVISPRFFYKVDSLNEVQLILEKNV